ncbi:M15 family metallopeptidase [Desulfogranum mediterraneum]|uniref:M15 family metallopeptidase n=1 Tax=Desulfogranum mediterraneum TaxID=160661 RepID=UPI000420457A|nr:M15 family metallopeptidase [Desulfogranum mediterraneum]
MKNILTLLILISLPLVSVPLVIGCSPVVPLEEVSPQQSAAAASRHTRVEAVAKKTEIITLAGKGYPVPKQWQGRRVASRALGFEELALIPGQLSHEHSKLYLLKDAQQALIAMAAAAREDGIQLCVHSSYRSSWYQRKIFARMFAQGRSYEDVIRYVAPPGYSEHALGTVVDFYPSNWRFAATPAYRWLQQHGSEFSFQESYPQDQPDGHPWEAWHWRWQPRQHVLSRSHPF